MGWVINATPRPVYHRERPGNHYTGGWVGLRAGLDGRGESRLPHGFDPRTVQTVASRYTDWANTAPTTNMVGPLIQQLVDCSRIIYSISDHMLSPINQSITVFWTIKTVKVSGCVTGVRITHEVRCSYMRIRTANTASLCLENILREKTVHPWLTASLWPLPSWQGDQHDPRLSPAVYPQ